MTEPIQDDFGKCVTIFAWSGQNERQQDHLLIYYYFLFFFVGGVVQNI